MYNLTIISMFKNESLILEEWINYYINQGVEHFYLIDNGSTDDYEKKINKYMDKITLIKDPFRVKNNTTNKLKTFDNNKNTYVFTDSPTHTQVLLSNKYFLEKIKNESTWIIFIDCDEYIYIPKSKNINDFLINLDKKYDEITDIFVPWKIFGSNNQDKQPNSIIKGFNKRIELNKYKNMALQHGNIRGFGKSITKTKYLTLLNIHKCNLYIPMKTLMPDYSIIENNKNNLVNFIKNLDYNNNFIYCNHYIVMSNEYFNIKIQRDAGCDIGRRSNKDWNKYFHKFNHNDIIDDALINYFY